MNNLKKICIITAFVLCLTILNNAQTENKMFVGDWTLNKTKTSVKDLPIELKNYKLLIDQFDEKINVKHYIDGFIEPRFDNKNSSSGSARPQDGIWGDSRGSTNTGLAVKPNYGGSMALSKYFSPSEVAYNLDGKESDIDILQEGNKVGSARVKAKMEKEGKSFKVTTVRKMKTMKAGQTEMIIYVREKWNILDDGKTLKYIKTVELPNAIDETILYFSKN